MNQTNNYGHPHLGHQRLLWSNGAGGGFDEAGIQNSGGKLRMGFIGRKGGDGKELLLLDTECGAGHGTAAVLLPGFAIS